MLQHIGLLVFPAVMLFAAFSDMFTMKISNVVSLTLLAAYLVLAFAVKMPMESFLLGLACGAGILAVTFGMFAMGWIGGGDAKLAAATALWMGWPLLLPYLAVAAVFGGVLTIVLILFRRLPLPAGLARLGWLTRLHERGGGIPYGMALAAAGLYLYSATDIWRAGTGV